MADVALATPRLRVVLSDDSEHEVQVINADLVRYDETRNKHRWPGPEQAPFLWLTFCAWAAMRRTSALPATTTWESFRDTTLEVSDLTQREGTGATDVADPSQTAVEPG